MKISPTVIIDTREQMPLIFPTLPTIPGSLPTGDYSAVGFESVIAIERKSLPDLLACCGSSRDRFKAELQRLRAYRFRALVIEASAAEIARGEWRSQLHPSHVFGALASWSARFTLPVWLGGTHTGCAEYVERFIVSSVRILHEEHAAFAAAIGQEVTAP